MRKQLTVALVALGLAGAAALGLALTPPPGPGAGAQGRSGRGCPMTAAPPTGRWRTGARPPLHEPDPRFLPYGLMSPNVITPRPSTAPTSWGLH
jgi:hypothetical protein